MNEFLEKALLWKDRPPSGLYIMHRVPRDHWCRRHGRVTKWHECCWHLEKILRPKIKPIKA